MRKVKYLQFIRPEKGASVLVSVVVIMVLLISVSLTIAALGLGEINISTNDKEAKEALSNAEAGVKDALIKVVRNRNFQALSPGYELQLTKGTATIEVIKDIPSQNKDTVYSTGNVNDKKRRIEAILNIDSKGKVTIDSFKEVTNF